MTFKTWTMWACGALAWTALGFDCSPAVKARARAFVEKEGQFHLGFLPTEQSNPITATLEEDFHRSTLAGLQCLQRADRQIPIVMRHVFAGAPFAKLVDSMERTLRAPKGRIVFSGCGATGRLSILLESVWRDFFHRRAAELAPEERALADRSASIMTGGDFALIKSVESFEDSARGGERQAAALGVGAGDTFVAITEGGETSSVLGTLRYAAAHGARCFLVFNNPADILRARLDRCREAIDNPRVTVLDIYCGSMGLAGSTRMQATTSEQLLGSVALERALVRLMPRFARETAPDATTAFEATLAALETPAARASIAGAIDFERQLYARGGRVTYFADDCMLDLFTDTTERSPTFMLPPFRSTEETALAQSWAFVKNPLHDTPRCWDALFHRDLRCLEWTAADYAAPGMPALKGGALPKITRAHLLAYPVGNEDTPLRYTNCDSAAVIVRAGAPDAAFETAARAAAAKFGTVRLFAVTPVAASPLEVWKHLAVKLTFNNLSTGTMAAMGRVAGNWMSWVAISNKKLIDRGIRLIAELGRIPYAEAAERLFAAEEWIASQDWTGRETPCAVQVALKELARAADGAAAKTACPVGANTRGHENIEWSTAYGFHLTDRNKALPRVLLVGDSICSGYKDAVQRRLEGRVNVSYWISSYCLTMPAYRRLLEHYLEESRYDVIHFNNGLHSLGTDTETWARHFRQTLALIRARQPQAKIVFCTSTPLKNPQLTAKARALNDAARRVIAEGASGPVAEDDLFALVDPLDRAQNWSDTYHHKPPVREREAEQVAATVLQALGQQKMAR